jgi:peptidoglycan/LPS O-acetylase OafA/YrhL
MNRNALAFVSRAAAPPGVDETTRALSETLARADAGPADVNAISQNPGGSAAVGEFNPCVARTHAFDGLRGLLALIVVLWHATSPIGLLWFAYPAKMAVFGFFVLSGLVLTRAWDGRVGVFLLQRIVRLWPTYAVCLAAGYVIAGAHPDWRQFAWFPLMVPDAEPRVDPPTWSLVVEAWAMPLMPLIVWCGSGSLARAWVAAIACIGAVWITASVAFQQYWLALSFFVIGALLARWSPRAAWLEAAPMQWVGKISYSLYLSHWLVFALARELFGPIGGIAALPLAFPVGWLVWRTIERPSIVASRRVKSGAGRLADSCASARRLPAS